ncbi:hypothetical protein BGZ67_009007 [Mortierella alpina]|nr:hypothetical protein BGZ67_009007 [Mortierella alpina]
MVNPRSGSTDSKEKDNHLTTKESDFDDVVEEDIDELLDESGDEEDNEYEVEKVVGHKRERGVLSYFLKWKGYDVQDNTWEKEDQVFCEDLVEAYWDRYTQAGGKKTDLKGSDPKPQGIKRKAAGGRGRALSKELQESLLPEVSSMEPSDDNAEESAPVASPSKKKGLNGSDELSEEQGQAKKHKSETQAGLEQAHGSQNDAEDEQDEEPRKAGRLSKDGKASKEGKASKAGKEGKEAKAGKEGNASKEGKAGKAAGKASKEPWPPASWTTWEDEVDFVQTVERNNKIMRVYLVWKNGKQTDHPIEVAHSKCPIKLIHFYEEHLKFTQS